MHRAFSVPNAVTGSRKTKAIMQLPKTDLSPSFLLLLNFLHLSWPACKLKNDKNRVRALHSDNEGTVHFSSFLAEMYYRYVAILRNSS